MTHPVKKNIPTVSARDFVQGRKEATEPASMQIMALEENQDVYILDARNDKALSGAFERYGLWHQASKRGRAPTLERVKQFLEERGQSCDTKPDNCGTSRVFTIELGGLARFYNQLPASPGTDQVMMTSEEYRLMKDMEDAGLFSRNAKGELVAARPKAVLMAMSRSAEPDGISRAEVFSSAFLNVLPALEPKIRIIIESAWRGLNQEDRDFLILMLNSTRYFNTKNLGQLLTTIGAYSYFPPDHRMGMAGLLNIANRRCMEEKGAFPFGWASCLPFWGTEEKTKAMEVFWKLHNAVAPALRKKLPKLD